MPESSDELTQRPGPFSFLHREGQDGSWFFKKDFSFVETFCDHCFIYTRCLKYMVDFINSANFHCADELFQRMVRAPLFWLPALLCSEEGKRDSDSDTAESSCVPQGFKSPLLLRQVINLNGSCLGRSGRLNSYIWSTTLIFVKRINFCGSSVTANEGDIRHCRSGITTVRVAEECLIIGVREGTVVLGIRWLLDASSCLPGETEEDVGSVCSHNPGLVLSLPNLFSGTWTFEIRIIVWIWGKQYICWATQWNGYCSPAHPSSQIVFFCKREDSFKYQGYLKSALIAEVLSGLQQHCQCVLTLCIKTTEAESSLQLCISSLYIRTTAMCLGFYVFPPIFKFPMYEWGLVVVCFYMWTMSLSIMSSRLVYVMARGRITFLKRLLIS